MGVYLYCSETYKLNQSQLFGLDLGNLINLFTHMLLLGRIRASDSHLRTIFEAGTALKDFLASDSISD